MVAEVRASSDDAMADGFRFGEGWFLESFGDAFESGLAVRNLCRLVDGLLTVFALDVEAAVGGADAVGGSVVERDDFAGASLESGKLYRGGAAVDDEDWELGHGILRATALRLIWIS